MQTAPSQKNTPIESQNEPFLVAGFIMPFLDFYCGTEDHLGSTRMVLAQNGEIKEALMYQPYGTASYVVGISGPMPDPLREKFTENEFDEDEEDAANGVFNSYFILHAAPNIAPYNVKMCSHLSIIICRSR